MRLIALIGLLLLGGCSSLGIPNPLGAALGGPPTITLTGNPIADAAQFQPVTAKLAQFTAADIDNALADAQSQTPPDAAAMGCWQTVKSALPIVNVPANSGVATGIQKARDAQRWIPIILQQCANIIAVP